MNNDKAISKIRGLVALIRHENTPEHERQTAERLLAEICERFSISIDEAMQPETKEYFFKAAREKWAEKMLLQIVWKVIGKRSDEIEFTRHKKGSKTVGFTFSLTPAQNIEVSEYFEFYRELYAKEIKAVLKRFETAFYHKHDIFGVSSGETKEEKIEQKDIWAIRDMMRSLSDETYLKKIE